MTRQRLTGILVFSALLHAVILGFWAARTRGSTGVQHSSGTQPAVVALFEALDSQGLSASLDALDRAAARDSAVLRDGHQLAHALGRGALERANGDASVLAQCRPIFASGCYHGVIEATVQRSRRVDMTELDRMCSAAGSEQNPAPVYQCVHGLGHGVLRTLGLDVERTLRHCDALPEPRFAAVCREGVFMEAINSTLAPAHHRPAGAAHRHGSTQGAGLSLDPSNPYAPCDRFDDPHATSCWLFQGFLILRYRGFDAAAALATCDAAPSDLVKRCYESVGFQLTGVFQRDDGWVIEQCAKGQAGLASSCAAGATVALSEMDWSGVRAIRFCGATPAEWKEPCYRGAAARLSLLASPARRAELCGLVERQHAEACRQGAGLVGRG